MVNRHLLNVVALPLVLAACAPALQPIPQGASVSAPLEWRTHISNAGRMEERWWLSFGDPMLAQLVQESRTHNPDINLAAARVAEARATEQVSRSLLLPSIGVGVDAAARREVLPFGRAQESLAVLPAFRASYEVDVFGKTDPGLTQPRQTFLLPRQRRSLCACR